MDGKNLIPYLLGQEAGEPHGILYWRKEGMAAIRRADHKLIRLDQYGYRLYNLEEDPGEMRDLSEQEAALSLEMKEGLESWESGLMFPLWSESKPWQQVTFEIHKALMENREVTIKSPADLPKIQD